MDKIKRYIECYVPVTTCNLQCHYCYITRQGKWKDELFHLTRTPQEVVTALSRKRLGGTCLINICAGGETLLCAELPDIIRALLEEGHYVMVVNNGTVRKALEKIASFPKYLLNRLIFKFSYHYLEHHRLGLTEHFFNNIKMMRDAGCSFTLEITPNDEVVEHIPAIMEETRKYLGALCHVTIARDDIADGIPILTNMSEEDFYKTWEQFNSGLFDFKRTIFGKYQNHFCYAGEWSVYVNIETGEMTQCYEGRRLDNIYANPEKPLHFEAMGCRCKTSHCYNGHAFLSLGDMPELNTPSYASLRNRTDDEGNTWLTEDMEKFLSGKLGDNNKEYSSLKKWLVNRKK